MSLYMSLESEITNIFVIDKFTDQKLSLKITFSWDARYTKFWELERCHMHSVNKNRPRLPFFFVFEIFPDFFLLASSGNICNLLCITRASFTV